MADKKNRLVISDLRGGRNGYDPPWAIADNQCADAVNVEFYKSRLGAKRGGCLKIDLSGTVGWVASSVFSNLFRHVPTTDETAAELWAAVREGGGAGNCEFARMAGSAVFAFPTLKDAMTGFAEDVTATSLNGKLFLAYKSAVDRLHVWDGSTVRRTGLAATAAPTVANTGAGAYAAVLRYYRQRSTVQSGGITVRRSEPSLSVSFTPSGAGTAARVTQATVINEGETHWEVEAGLDGVTFYRIATVAIGTTTYDDSAVTTTYNTNPLSAATGFYTLQTSYKFIASDQARILGFGSFTATNKQDDIIMSAVIGSSDIGDDERVDTTTNYRLGLDENDSGVATGLRGPIGGNFIATKEQQIWELTPTGQPALPYRADALSKSVGAVTQVAIDRGEDAAGNPALYLMSRYGPYQWTTQRGLIYIGRNNEDYIMGPTAVFNANASVIAARTLYYPIKRQVYFWWAIGSSNTPNAGFIYDVTTSAWSRIPSTDLLATIQCAVMFSNTLGASMSKDLKPYFGGPTSTIPTLYKGDTGTLDDATTFKAYVVTKAVSPGSLGFYGEVGDGVLIAAAATGVTITDTVTADFGLQTQTGTALLTASAANESIVIKRLEGSALSGDVAFVQHQIGDAASSSSAWNLHALIVPEKSLGAIGQ